MKKGAILIEDLYNELEFWVPFYRMLEAGVEMTVVGPKAGATYKSKIGMAATSDAAAGDLNGADFDLVIIPGGYAPDRMRRDGGMVKLVRDAHEADKIVAFICHAGWLPITAGIVKGMRLTSFFAIKDDMVNAGAEWVDEAVVVGRGGQACEPRFGFA